MFSSIEQKVIIAKNVKRVSIFLNARQRFALMLNITFCWKKKKINENTYFYLEQNMANMNNKSVNCILKYPFLKNLNGQSL